MRKKLLLLSCKLYICDLTKAIKFRLSLNAKELEKYVDNVFMRFAMFK